MSGTIKELHQVQVHVTQLQLGMYVSALDRDWLETPFLFQGFLLTDPDDLFTLRSLCDHVVIDLPKSRTMTLDLPAMHSSEVVPRPAYGISNDVQSEIRAANTGYRQAFSEVRNMLKGIQEGDGFDAAQMRLAVRACLDSVIRNPSALLWLTRIKHVDQYTAEHCLNVGIQAMALGRHLGLGRKHIELLGLCGMLHDVGKMRVDQAILNKPGRVSTEEFEHLKLHVTYGREELSKDPDMPREVIAAAYSHHERLDGNGYPEGLAGAGLGFYTRLVTIVDAYDAITSSRCYSASNSSATALKILYENRGTQFDEKLVVRFIECIGLYPPGALVEMSSGEVGVVLSVDPAHRLLPKVALVRDAGKRPMTQQVVDLAAEQGLQPEQRMRVARVLTDGEYGVDLEDFTIRNISLSDQLD
ncbi:HD-GYP domain-containing protein [Pseudomonas sp.]|jgi:putative nucleotidyltransferase with HDIG domain|uniref:HD-GYP domain-containing protein n=1 Tax=Pseudomonas sp. TaxID=306 RepID=UPI00272C4942|nr:HD-GYP domain-containing protein [Pseudomonas sp.]